jgi:hypothetical protein
MCVLPTLSVMAYPVHAVYRTYVILDADYNVCSVLTVFENLFEKEKPYSKVNVYVKSLEQ